jgi:hypothetical protein
MILRPEGLIASARRRRELHRQETEEGQFDMEFGTGGAQPAVTATSGEARQET